MDNPIGPAAGLLPERRAAQPRLQPARATIVPNGAGHDMGSIFPMPAGQGASWNRTLVRAVAAAVAVEARASGADRGFSPELQVATDPRFGAWSPQGPRSTAWVQAGFR